MNDALKFFIVGFVVLSIVGVPAWAFPVFVILTLVVESDVLILENTTLKLPESGVIVAFPFTVRELEKAAKDILKPNTLTKVIINTNVVFFLLYPIFTPTFYL